MCWAENSAVMGSITPQTEYSAVEITDYSKYFAHELTRRFPTDSAEKLAGAMASAQVDLNPHQVDATLFARRFPRARRWLMKSAWERPSRQGLRRIRHNCRIEFIRPN